MCVTETKKRKKEREESGQSKWMEMARQAENKQLARKTFYDEAVQNTDIKMFCDSDFNLSSGTRATKITIAHGRSLATTRSMAASKMESTLETGQWEDFPLVLERSSRKHIDNRIIRCTAKCLADYKVSRKDVTGIIIITANTIGTGPTPQSSPNR